MARDNNPIRSLNISNLAHWTNADEIEEFLNLLPDVSSKATADAPYSIVMHSATKTVMNDNSLVSIATNKGWTIG